MYSAWPLPRSARKSWSGAAAEAAPIATLPSKPATVRRNASVRLPPVSADRRDMTAGMTFASVVIGPGIRRPCCTLMSAWLSTSPFSAATT